VARSRKGSRIKTLKWWVLKAIAAGILLVVGLTFLEVFLFRFMNPSVTANETWRWVRSQLTTTPYGRMRQEWRPIEEISPHLRKAVLAAEDQRFLNHSGFDFVELNIAMQDALEGKSLRGASTITMQTARTVFLWPSRTFLRKALEAYYTVLMEICWGKPRVLEIYLNTVDWGEGVMGIEAASQHYFQRSSAELSREQAALLAAVLPSPHRWFPGDPGPRILYRQQRILRDMEKMPLVSVLLGDEMEKVRG